MDAEIQNFFVGALITWTKVMDAPEIQQKYGPGPFLVTKVEAILREVQAAVGHHQLITIGQKIVDSSQTMTFDRIEKKWCFERPDGSRYIEPKLLGSYFALIQ